jgi:ribosomal protein S18 acetylase RimI-like enzyme
MTLGAPTITVEPLRWADLVAVAQCIAIDADAFPYASAQFALPSTSAHVWVAHEAGEQTVLGFAAARSRYGTLHVDGLAVHRAFRRRNIGRTLVHVVAAHARAEGMRSVALRVSVANRTAIALYTAEGFLIERRLRGFYPATAFEGETDAYAMELLLWQGPGGA